MVGIVCACAMAVGCDKHPPREKSEGYGDKKAKPAKDTPTPTPAPDNAAAPSFFPPQGN
jgi:hypothetical protein